MTRIHQTWKERRANHDNFTAAAITKRLNEHQQELDDDSDISVSDVLNVTKNLTINNSLNTKQGMSYKIHASNYNKSFESDLY